MLDDRDAELAKVSEGSFWKISASQLKAHETDIQWETRLRQARRCPNRCSGGIWTEFRGDRGTKSKPIPGPHLVYGFLTTAPNTIVEPIHSKPCRRS